MPEEPSAQPELPRVLGLFDVMGIVIGSVIGSGIFLVPAAIALQVKSPLLIALVWVVGGLLSFLGMLAFSELNGLFPKAGGMYVYLREAFGPLPAFLFGWTLFLVIDSGAVATLAVAFASKYLPLFLPMNRLTEKLITLGLIGFLVTVNCLGVRWGARLQNLLTLIKTAAILGVVVVAFTMIKGSLGHFTSPATEPFSGGLVTRFGEALIACLWAYKGWEAATFSAGEIQNPQRNLFRGLVISGVIIIVLYLAANAAYLWAFPSGEIAQSARIAADTMQRAMGTFGAALISFLILFSIAGAANANILTSPRVYYAMACDGLFFKSLAKVHPRFQTPYVSIVIMGIWSAVLALSGTFETLAAYVVFGQWIFFGLTVAAVPMLRRKLPLQERAVRTWGYPITPVIFIAASLFIAVAALLTHPRNALFGLGLILTGIPVYYVMVRRRPAEPEASGT